MKYFSFLIGSDEWDRWGTALPIPSYKKILTSINGHKIQVAYELKYRPITPFDWYFVADVQRSYQAVIKGVIFNDSLIIENDGWESAGKSYTLAELKIFPTDGAPYPVIMRWASTKKTFRTVAFIYAKRLKYEGLLSPASVMGALTAINSKMSQTQQQKVRTLERLKDDILAQSDEWVIKLSKEALHIVKSDLGKQRGKQLQADKEKRINQIRDAVSSGAFMKPSGEINRSKLAEYLGIDRRTVFNLLPLALMVVLWIRSVMYSIHGYA
ncbi:MAG: hypothetical protein Q8S01_00955 [Ignavibacteria bacterium]|nr:hypothetical protein [Ignavibacteria bacterium]